MIFCRQFAQRIANEHRDKNLVNELFEVRLDLRRFEDGEFSIGSHGVAETVEILGIAKRFGEALELFYFRLAESLVSVLRFAGRARAWSGDNGD